MSARPATVLGASVNCLSLFSRRAAAHWDMRDGRYHVWFNVDTLELDSERVLYKNAPLTIPRGHPDFFDARRLRLDVPKNAEMVRQAFADIAETGATQRAIEDEKAKERAKQAEYEVEAHAEKIRQAAPQLVAALRELMLRCDGAEGVRADGSNIQTIAASALLESLGEV